MNCFSLLQIGFIVYRHFVNQNKKTMNFDNPVYRKTTEEQFAIEKPVSTNNHLPSVSVLLSHFLLNLYHRHSVYTPIKSRTF